MEVSPGLAPETFMVLFFACLFVSRFSQEKPSSCRAGLVCFQQFGVFLLTLRALEDYFVISVEGMNPFREQGSIHVMRGHPSDLGGELLCQPSNGLLWFVFSLRLFLQFINI